MRPIGALIRNEFGDVQVAAAWFFGVSLKQGRRGGVHPPTSGDAVKTRYTKRSVAVRELFQARLGNSHSRPGGKPVNHKLPPAHIIAVVMCRELCYPQPTVLVGEIRLRPRASQ